METFTVLWLFAAAFGASAGRADRRFPYLVSLVIAAGVVSGLR